MIYKLLRKEKIYLTRKKLLELKVLLQVYLMTSLNLNIQWRWCLYMVEWIRKEKSLMIPWCIWWNETSCPMSNMNKQVLWHECLISRDILWRMMYIVFNFWIYRDFRTIACKTNVSNEQIQDKYLFYFVWFIWPIQPSELFSSICIHHLWSFSKIFFSGTNGGHKHHWATNMMDASC